MDKDFSSRLLGSRSAAMEAAVEFQTKMQLAAANGNRHQFKFGLLLFRSLCVALQSSKVQHFDIICDIAEQTVFPNVNPCDKTLNYWDTFLSVLRYFLHTLGNKNIKKHNAMYEVLKKMHYTLKTEGDYKCFLDIHIQHLSLQQHQPHTIQVSEEIASALESLSELFENMFNLMKSDGFSYPELLSELNKLILAKRSTSYLKFLSSLPTQSSNKMFNSLFKLISALPTVDSPKESREHLNMFLALLQIDINDAKLQQQLALQHLRYCRDLFKADSMINYFFQLLYYYIKLAYNRTKVPEFRQTYWGLCKKFTNFFESKSETHLKDQWFLDTLVVMQRMQILLHFNINHGPFDVFWEQMNGDIELYTMHFNLLLCCIKLSANIPGSELGVSCSSNECSSIRKHVILSFGTSTLATYFVFMQQNQLAKSEKDMNELTKSFLSIIRYTVSVICTMPCMSSSSTELLYIIQRFIKMGPQITKPSAHVTVYLQLVQYLPKIRDKIAVQDWQKIMRYVYKTSALSDQQQLSISMHCLYIATLVEQTNLRNQITFFYQCTKNSEKCITQILDECQSPLKTELTDYQKRHIFIEEMSLVQTYFKQNTPLIKSLLLYCKEAHDCAILSRYLKSDKEVMEKQRKTYLSYRLKSQTEQLSRLDHLVFAYACTAQLNDLAEQQKHQIDIKTITESCMEEYLCNRDLTKVDDETKRLNVAIEALHAFETFYDRADLEPIDADSQILIDWESIMDDITNVAYALQLMGYMSEATNAWLLLHRITCMLDDRFNYLRAVTFFFAHSDLFEAENRIDLQCELNRTQQIIADVLPQLKSVNIFKRYQTITLLCLCQMANYYGKSGCLQYAYALLVKVSKIRDEFEERRGKVDIIFLTMQIVRYRLIWQHKTSQRKSNVLVLRVMDMILESFRIFTSLSSVDNTFCMLLSMDFVQNCIECSANRFGERISLVFTVLNMSLQSGLSLRAIQLFTFLLWSDLQMEYEDKAQSMLRIIEHLFCGNLSTKSDGGGNNSSCPSIKPKKPKANCHEQINNHLAMQLNSAFVEPIRRQNVKQLSEELEKLDLSDKSQSVQLESFRNAEEKCKYLQGNRQLQWTYFIVGCFKARLHYLAKDFGQLNDFYEHTENWLKKHSSHKFLTNYYKNMQLVNAEFYVNYLRSAKVFDKASSYLKIVLENAQNFQHVDVNYRYNLSLQLKTVDQEQAEKSQVKPSNLRRALVLSRFPDKSLGKTLVSNSQNKTDKLKGKANSNKTSSFEKFTSPSSSSSSSGSDDVDLNACQIIEIIDLDDTVETNDETIKPKGEMKRNATNRSRNPLGTDSNKQSKNDISEDTSQSKTNTKSKNPRAASANTKTRLKQTAINPPTKILTPNKQIQKLTTTQRSGRSNLTSMKSMENFVTENDPIRKTRAQLRRLASQHKENMAK